MTGDDHRPEILVDVLTGRVTPGAEELVIDLDDPFNGLPAET